MQPLHADAPRRPPTRFAADPIATGLGWFSIGLGAVELVAPDAVARCLGMERRRGLIQFYGVREILTGLGILTTGRPGPWLWARVAGDLLDMATLGTGLDRDNPQRTHAGLALGAVAGVALVDFACARAYDAGPRPGPYVAPDYRRRSGFPRPPAEMRGAGRRPPPRPARPVSEAASPAGGRIESTRSAGGPEPSGSAAG